MLDIQDILKHLPHRYPFLLIDRVVGFEKAKSIHALKNVTYNEAFFVGHFPDKPVMPGVLILEALAQASGILAYESAGEFESTKALAASSDTPITSLYYLAGIDNARFKQMVLPGDQLQLHVDIVKVKREIWKCHGEAFVEDKLVCSADIMCARKEEA